MAAKKKAAAKSTENKFLALVSDCGSAEQFRPINNLNSGNDYYRYPTIEAARKAIAQFVDFGNLESGGTVAIAEIVDVGTASGVQWGKKPSKSL